MKSLLVCILLLVGIPVTRVAAQHSQLPVAPGDKDKCPVCGMFIKDYPRWWAEIIYNDGAIRYFDGPKDMFRFYLHPELYGDSVGRIITGLYVREYYTLGWIDARAALFVIDSDVYGPMGRELVPLKTIDDAREFKQDHHGGAILRCGDVTWEMLQRLSEGEEM